jgi:hypothetical protein
MSIGFIYVLLLPERQTDEGWEHSKSNVVSDIVGNLGEEHCFLVFKSLQTYFLASWK